jgi:hypothetical protein
MKYIYAHSNKRPCQVYPQKKLVVIDPSFWSIKNYNMRIFVLLHELAHVFYFQEQCADAQALIWYYGAGYPLRDCFFALTRILPMPSNSYRVKDLISKLPKDLKYEFNQLAII